MLDDLGFDACVDRTATDWRQQLDDALPDGVDMDFENSGGEVMDAVLMRLNIGARVVLCGMIATYDALGTDHEIGQKAISQLIMQRSTMYGFLVLDHVDRFGEAIDHLAGHLAGGRLRHDELVLDGLDRAPEALTTVFEGRHRGKVLVRVAGPELT